MPVAVVVAELAPFVAPFTSTGVAGSAPEMAMMAADQRVPTPPAVFQV